MSVRPLACALLLAACADGGSPREQACARLEAPPWSVDQVEARRCPAALPGAPLPPGARKLAVAVYHFNVQYVAGGVRGFPTGEEIVPTYDLDEVETEDRIVRQGLEPVLDLYLGLPEAKADIELQAYMVEVIARRHPDVLAKMVELARRDQVAFDSFHYSDQLYVAYPERDLQASLELTRQVFARACLPPGRSIFTQEGQFAAGQVPLAARRGYAVSVLPKNLFAFQHGEVDPRVLYQLPSVPEHSVILGGRGFRGVDLAGQPVELVWTFMDDGEIAFTEGRLNPYFGLDYLVDPARLAEKRAELLALSAQGYVHTTIAEAVERLRALGVEPAPLPPVLDGTWQPDDTANLGRWMGGFGLFRAFERDSDVLAAVWRARRRVARAEVAVAHLASGSGWAPALASAWREALLAEVSDSTGWNPFKNEVEYAFTHAALAEAQAADLLLCLGEALEAEPPCELPTERSAASLRLELVAPPRAMGRYTPELRRCVEPGVHRFTVQVAPEIEAERLFVDGTGDEEARVLELVLSPSAGVPPRILPAFGGQLSPLAAERFHFASIGLAPGYGLVGLGEGRFVVQDLSRGRVALTWDRAGGGLRFTDATVSRAHGGRRDWYVLEDKSEAEALAFALRLNGP